MTLRASGQYNRPVQRNLRLLFAALTVFILPGCDKETPADKSPLAGHNVLLITLDTTRADRLGYHGYTAAKTPALDALAARGVVFDDAIAQVPLTLPSHGTILTGRFPKEFGVRINNQGAIGDTHPRLPNYFKERGYRTAAFVATFVLDARFGLDRGFEHYDDDMVNMSMKNQPLEWEQPANIIADRALAWLGKDTSKPFFAWLHFYDPHDPYTPPAPYPKDYNGEIAFMDTQLKRVFDWLDASGQRERTLVVVVGDHGESFGEHGEEGHGMFLYHTSLHVPLIFAHPTLTPKPLRVANTAGAIDVFPTILDLFSIPKPEGLMSRSLVESIRTGGQPPHDVYSESDYVWQTYGWAQQRSFTNPTWKFISSTKPELYDRKSDSAEKKNLFDTQRHPAALELSNKLAEFYGAKVAVDAGNVPPSAAAAAALETLGYVAAGALSKDEFLSEDAADPKEKLHIVADYKTARKLVKEERYPEAVAMLRTVVAEAPRSLAIYAALGNALVQSGKYAEAIEVFEKHVLPLNDKHQPALISLGDAYFLLGNLEKAKAEYTLAIENDPLDSTAHYKMAKTYSVLKKPEEAKKHFGEAVRLFPDFPEARAELATLQVEGNEYAPALQNFQRSIELKPDNALVQYNYGRLLLITGNQAKAVEHLREATKLNPQYGEAWINLGIALIQSGDMQGGKEAMRRATEIPGSAVEAHWNLSIAAKKENDRAAEKGHYERILELKPGHSEAKRELDRLLAQP